MRLGVTFMLTLPVLFSNIDVTENSNPLKENFPTCGVGGFAIVLLYPEIS